MGRLVEIAAYFSPEEALCARSYLQSEGLEVLLQNEHLLTADPAMRIAVGGFRLLALSSDDAAHARTLLKAVEAHDRSDDDDNALSCPSCGSRKVKRQRNIVWVPIAFGFGAPFVPYTGNYVCRSCKTVWREEQTDR